MYGIHPYTLFILYTLLFCGPEMKIANEYKNISSGKNSFFSSPFRMANELYHFSHSFSIYVCIILFHLFTPSIPSAIL